MIMLKSKKQKSNKISESTQLGVLMEHIDEKVTLTAEHVSGLTKKVESLDKKIDGLDKKIENLDIRVEGLDIKMERVEKTLEHHTEMIGSLMVNMEVVKNDVELIKNSLRKKVDVEEFEALEKRVIFLESKLLNR